MSNGFTPNPATDLPAWAIHHAAEAAEKFYAQEGKNNRTDAWMLSQERRIQKLENRGAAVNAYAMMLGGAVCAVLSVVATLVTQYLIK